MVDTFIYHKKVCFYLLSLQMIVNEHQKSNRERKPIKKYKNSQPYTNYLQKRCCKKLFSDSFAPKLRIKSHNNIKTFRKS